ncbi:putative membrane protein [Natrinema pellirubrum DSM 15624]|uniref:Membrane protein n=1 Tax=Natrinema pellirubrum (strain DSM 15624 / CIP 106293 / JCM 10476 / NCIMB 786 / 157) TaxID=797303 RepID=L0JKR9_NATP1|nr:putative membrane protein [Natrinema pellirubrum DSM 15624]
MIDRGRGVDLTGRVLRLAKDQQLTLLAAGVAFYGFLSLVPLMLLALGLAASVGGEALADRLSAAATDILTVQAQTLLADAVTDETGRRGATVAGILGLLWGSSRVLRGLDRAFSQVYDTVGEKSLLDTIWDAMIVSIAITAGLALLGALELVVRFPPGLEVSFAVAVVGQLFVVLGLFVTFLPLYVIFPDANVGIREAAPGTVIAAVGWFVLSRTFSLYAGLLSDYAVYGALGAVFLVLIWLYVGAIILVFAAVVNAVLADRELDRQLQSPGRRQIPTEAMTDDATGADEGATEDRASDRARESSASARTRDRADDPAALREEIERLRDRVDDFESDVEERTVRKESLESELKRYVRRRVRRGHARDWGPYLVLLYGTAMSIGAFYFLNGGWAILAMLVVWTSTLGLYVLMVLLGFGISLLGLPGRLRDAVGDRR